MTFLFKINLVLIFLLYYIIGGDSAHNPMPWMVAIEIKKEGQCTGTLINNQFVLTAAHCFCLGKIYNFFLQKKYFFSGLELCTRDIQTVVEGESIKANKVKQNLKEKVTTVSRKQTSQKTLWYILEEQV